MQAATSSPLAASAGPAVTYDLAVVTTQLRQEQAIRDAYAQLQRSAGLDPAQLAALGNHQPFMVPVDGPIAQPFGPTAFTLEPSLDYHGVFYPHFHTGLDISAPFGVPVRSAADGVVALATSSRDSAGHLVGYGNYIVIAHSDGFLTLYAHLSQLMVTTGQPVQQGTLIGAIGSTGNSTGPHLHFEIRHGTGTMSGTDFLDPYPYLVNPQH